MEIIRYDSSLYSFSVLDPVSAKIKKYNFITESIKVFVDVSAGGEEKNGKERFQITKNKSP